MIGITSIVILVGLAVYTMKQPIEMQADPIVQDFYSIEDSNSNGEQQRINEYDIKLEIDPESGIFYGSATVRFFNRTDKSLNQIYLNDYLNLNKQIPDNPHNDIRNGNTYIIISSVLINNEKMSMQRKNTVLELALNKPLKPNQYADFTINFDGRFYVPQQGSQAIIAKHILPTVAVYDENGWDLSNKRFLDKNIYYSDIANYKVDIKAPKEYVIVATGTETDTEEGESDKKVTKIVANRVRDFNFALSKYYTREFKETANGIKINLYTYGNYDLAQKELILNQAKDIMNYYNNQVGSYPYSEIDIIESNERMQSFQTAEMVVFSRDWLKQQYMLAENMAYSIGYQWFGNVIGTDAYNNPWLNESLIRFLFYNYFYYDSQMASLNQTMSKNVDNGLKEKKHLKLGNSLAQYKKKEDYDIMIQQKGSLLFYNLRMNMGKEQFQNFLRQYYVSYAYKNVNRATFIDCLKSNSNFNTDEFMNKWLN